MFSAPFWVIGAGVERELLPGLPISALMAFVPLFVVALLVSREEGLAGIKRLGERLVDYRRIPRRWLVPTLVLAPGLTVVAYAVMRVRHEPLPALQFPPVASVIGLCLAFLASGLAEESGWSGYATDPLQARWGALGAAVCLGFVWGAWHLIPLLQAHRGATWIAGWWLGTVANRVILVWLYDNTQGSILAAALYHATLNICWQLFPNRGSHYDPGIAGVLAAIVAGIVASVWGPRSLTRAAVTPANAGTGEL